LENVETFEYLISLGAQITIKNNLPMLWAVLKNHVDIVMLLLEGCDPNAIIG